MKILHTSDWHLGKRLGPFSRLPEQRAVLSEIIEICRDRQPDLILVAGDLFDNYNPSGEAVELLYSALKQMTRNGACPVVALGGNHDSPERIEAPDPLARECGIFFVGTPFAQEAAESPDGDGSSRRPVRLESGVEVGFPRRDLMEFRLPGVMYPVRLICAPYANEARLRTYLGRENREENLRDLLARSWAQAAGHCDGSGVNLFAGHFFMIAGSGPGGGSVSPAEPGELPFWEEDPPEPAAQEDLREPDGERPILCPGGLELLYAGALPPQIQYAALGHIHQRREIASPAVRTVYSGSPLAYSLSEAGQEKSVTLVRVEPGGAPEAEAIPLKAGRKIFRMTFDSPRECLEWLEARPDCYVEISLRTEDYITAETRNAIFKAHDGVLNLIPLRAGRDGEDRELSGAAGGMAGPEDLERPEEELFIDYFKKQNGGVEPGRELLEIFTQLLSLRGGHEE